MRMARALGCFPNRPVVLIGSDIPDLSAENIDQAFAALGRCDLTFGPARDGGYWLVGARESAMMAAAYNGGPGNLAKWKRRTLPYSKDPLMFIESIPARETRDFVERVLSNLWMYRERLGQATPSLDAIAAGELPLYKALDPSQIAEAESDYGRN